MPTSRMGKGWPTRARANKGDALECHFLKRNSLASNGLRAEQRLSIHETAYISINSSALISCELRAFPAIHV